MRKGILDDDYLFYDNGKILHSYDKTQTKLNIEEFISADSIPLEKKKIMLENCPKDKYDIVKSILEL